MPYTPQAVKFSNEQLRPFAREYARLKRMADSLVAYYNARPELGQEFSDGMNEVIPDNAAQDGRPLVTGNEALNLINRASEVEQMNVGVLNTILRYWDGDQ